MNVVIGRCGYAEPTEEGAEECHRSGKRITVQDPLGSLMEIVRCRRHSDWIEAPEALTDDQWDTGE